MKEKNSDQNQCSLSIKNNFIIRRLFYIGLPALTLSLFLIAGFQNCKSTKETGGEVKLSLPDVNIGDSKIPVDLLVVLASLNGQSQDHFPVGSAVDLELTPSDHQNLQTATSFDWTISEESWDPLVIYSCPPEPCEEQPDGSFSCPPSAPCPEDPDPPLREEMATKIPNTQFQFSEIGVYDVYVEPQEVMPSGVQNSKVGYGPKYEKSLVIGRCDQSDLQILELIQHSIPASVQNVETVSSLTNDHLSLVSKSPETSKYISGVGFSLELNGETLEVEPYSEERKIMWKIMAEMVDPSYGRWYQKFDQGDAAAWYFSQPENGIHYFGMCLTTCVDSLDGGSCHSYCEDTPSITSETKFSGELLIEAFAQLPGEECIHSTKKVFQLPKHLIPSVGIPSVSDNPPSTSTTTTSTTQGL